MISRKVQDLHVSDSRLGANQLRTRSRNWSAGVRRSAASDRSSDEDEANTHLMTEPQPSPPDLSPSSLTRDTCSISTTHASFLLVLSRLQRAVDGAVTTLGHSSSLASWDREVPGRSGSATRRRAGVRCGGESRCSAGRGLHL